MYSQKSRVMVMTYIVLGMISSICQAIDGSGTTNYIPKFTGTSTIGNSVLYESSSKIGIGTTSPLNTLHVNSGG